jgi:hypothetical protein
MERTKYFNHTRPTQTQLNYTESSKANGLLRRFRSSHQMGIVKGFIVTVNSLNNTKIDISAGESYTGGSYENQEVNGILSGERISTLTSTGSGDEIINSLPTATGVSLADYTNGADNYVALTYEETEDTPLAERYYPFTQHDTLVRETFSVDVFTQTEWENLSYTQKQNVVLLSIVNANGIGNPITTVDITKVDQPKHHPVVIQPTTLTGVTFSLLSSNTPIGTGVLRYVSGSKQIYWTAPGDMEGLPVVIASSGEYYLESSDTQYSISLAVIFAQLPAADVTENITVNCLYGRAIPIFSAVDVAHRDMIGSGQPSEANPHGLSWEDITGGTLAHADQFHVNGISIDADRSQLAAAIYDPGSTDEVRVNNIGSYLNSFLIDGNTFTEIDGYTPPNRGIISFDSSPSPLVGDYLIYLDSKAALKSVRIGTGGTAAGYALWNANVHILDIKNQQAGTGYINWDNGGGGNERTLSYKSPYDVGLANPYGTSRHVLVDSTESQIFKLYSYTESDWIIVEIAAGSSLGGDQLNYAIGNIDLNDSEIPDDSILRVAMVYWDAVSEQLSDLRDLRRFVTFDGNSLFEEEHDSEGLHTKVLRSNLKIDVGIPNQYGLEVYAGANAINGYARSSLAFYGSVGAGSSSCALFDAGYSAVIGSVTNNYGVVGSAGGSFGVFGTASRYGVAGIASQFGVYGSATNVLGVYGAAVESGAYGYAASSYGVVGSAVIQIGVLGSAQTIGVMGAAIRTGVYGAAASTGVYGTAAVSHGVIGAAADSAVAGSAGNVGVAGIAATNYGVFGSAAGYYGVYGVASNSAIVGSASKVGIVGFGTSAIRGVASGSAVATNSAIIGVYGSATNVGSTSYAYGVVGEVSNASPGAAVYGRNLGNGPGVYGQGNSVGVVGSGSACGVSGVGVLGGSFSGVVGVYGVGQDGGAFLGYASVPGTVYGVSAGATNLGNTVGAVALYGEVATGTAVKGIADSLYGVGGYFTGATGVFASGPPAIAAATAIIASAPVALVISGLISATGATTSIKWAGCTASALITHSTLTTPILIPVSIPSLSTTYFIRLYRTV